MFGLSGKPFFSFVNSFKGASLYFVILMSVHRFPGQSLVKLSAAYGNLTMCCQTSDSTCPKSTVIILVLPVK